MDSGTVRDPVRRRLDVCLRNSFQRDSPLAGNGGTVSVDWLEDAEADKLPWTPHRDLPLHGDQAQLPDK